MRENHRLELEMFKPTYVRNELLNEDVRYEEVVSDVRKLKCKKGWFGWDSNGGLEK